MTDLTVEYGYPPTTLSIAYEQCEVLTIDNALSGGTFANMSVLINGHTVVIFHGGGDEPDTFFIIPALGFTSSHDEIVIDDGASGVVDICAVGLS